MNRKEFGQKGRPFISFSIFYYTSNSLHFVLGFRVQTIYFQLLIIGVHITNFFFSVR